MAEEHPELVVAYMKGMIKVGRWANEHKHAAAAILNRQTFYVDVEDTYRGIKNIDMVPNLSPQNLASIEIGKDFMFSHGYIHNDFDVHEWAAPEFFEQAARELLEDEWKTRSMAKLPEATELGAPSDAARMNEEHIMTTTAVELVKSAASQLEQVAPKAAADERAAGKAVFVDVREAEEWQHGHIEGSVPAPRGLLEFFADPTSPRHKKELDPARRVIVVCASGARAALAGMTMKDMGYENVAVLAGGLKGWTEAGLPTCEHDYSGI